jgi:hypothetical protein
MIQRYGVQWRAYAVIFQLDEMHVRYPIALQKGNWIAERYKGIARVYASPEERAAYERQLIHECIPVAEAVLRTTDYSRHEIRPTNWHCSAKWCQVFAREECMGSGPPRGLDQQVPHGGGEGCRLDQHQQERAVTDAQTPDYDQDPFEDQPEMPTKIDRQASVEPGKLTVSIEMSRATEYAKEKKTVFASTSGRHPPRRRRGRRLSGTRRSGTATRTPSTPWSRRWPAALENAVARQHGPHGAVLRRRGDPGPRPVPRRHGRPPVRPPPRWRRGRSRRRWPRPPPRRRCPSRRRRWRLRPPLRCPERCHPASSLRSAPPAPPVAPAAVRPRPSRAVAVGPTTRTPGRTRPRR